MNETNTNWISDHSSTSSSLMIRRTSHSSMQRKVSAMKIQSNVAVTSEIRQKLIGFEDGCVDKFKEEPVDSIVKKDVLNLAGNGSNIGSGRFVSSNKRNYVSSCGSKVKPLSLEETISLMASQRRRRQPRNITGKPLLAETEQKQRNSPEKKKTALSNKGLSPREKVFKVLYRFRLKFKELDKDKARRRGESTSRIDCETRNILMSEGMQVNAGKRIGPVPGIKVGDEFQFKSELNLIGLHFDIMGGIDYMNRRGLKVATSIVASEGNHGYSDKFDYDVMIYSGQGGNVGSKDRKVMENQKLVTGNLALANSMREKTPVRVIRGKKRSDHRGKRYVYVGLYMVLAYWKEKGPEGKVIFRFKLRRVSGQPSIDLRH